MIRISPRGSSVGNVHVILFERISLLLSLIYIRLIEYFETFQVRILKLEFD